jgi:hypothetical protein
LTSFGTMRRFLLIFKMHSKYFNCIRNILIGFELI